jgi:hypothetical protein
MNKPFELKGKPMVSERAGVVIKRIGAHLGAEISDVDLRKPLSEAQPSCTSRDCSSQKIFSPTITANAFGIAVLLVVACEAIK